MGLLIHGDTGEDIAEIRSVLSGVAEYWKANYQEKWGFWIEFGNISIQRISHLCSEHIFTGKAIPVEPGPFKRAAAFAILIRLFVDFRFQPLQGGVHLSPKQMAAWRSRIAVLMIPIILKKAVLTNGGGKRKLEKLWKPATLHLHAEIHNWLRWLEKPERDGAWDIARLCRSIMVFAMVIEQSYYLADNNTNCDLMHDPHCTGSIFADPDAAEDIWWLLPEGMK